jgi:inhibitor of cysteine peptidase
MKKVVCLSLALLIIVFAAAACRGASADKMYGKDDKDITVDFGDTFSIQLESNPTTGYDWTVSISDKDVVSLVGNEYLPEPVDTTIVGSGGVNVFTFKGLEKGSAVVTLIYERSFEEDSAIETLVYNVTVK